MKIWIDITNSPHVNFFAELIDELTHQGHKLYITTRPLSHTIPLLDKLKIDYKIVGKHYGKSIFAKLFGFPIRIIELLKYIIIVRPDVSIAQASYYLPIVSFLAGVKSIYTNDNEHAKGNIPAFLFANKILLPEVLSNWSKKNFWISKTKCTFYPGIKEGIYLHNKVLDKEEIGSMILFRPEPSMAAYYKSEKNFLDNLIVELSKSHKVAVIPREELQRKYYSQSKFSNVEVLKGEDSLVDLASKTKLFIGAGGTMSREMSILGIPVISVYKAKPLEVDKYLNTLGLLLFDPEITPIEAEKFLIEQTILSDASKVLKNAGFESYNLLKSIILEYDNTNS